MVAGQNSIHGFSKGEPMIIGSNVALVIQCSIEPQQRLLEFLLIAQALVAKRDQPEVIVLTPSIAFQKVHLECLQVGPADSTYSVSSTQRP